jgi:hypothetical protein
MLGGLASMLVRLVPHIGRSFTPRRRPPQPRRRPSANSKSSADGLLRGLAVRGFVCGPRRPLWADPRDAGGKYAPGQRDGSDRGGSAQ